MTDTVIPNAEVREAARDLIQSLKADGYTDQPVMAELQQLADGQPIPKEVKKMKLSNDELIKIITENADRLCIFYITKEGGHLESLDLTNAARINGNSIQLNCETTRDA